MRSHADRLVNIIIKLNSSFSSIGATTISLSCGDTLGTGVDIFLSAGISIAEKWTGYGIPDVLFNSAPGPYSIAILSKSLGYTGAKEIVLGAKLYSAEEFFEMGLVDVLAERGEGITTVNDLIRSTSRCLNTVLTGNFSIRENSRNSCHFRSLYFSKTQRHAF